MRPEATAQNPDARFSVRDSPIHGRGLFAQANIPAGRRILEYVGERITKSESLKRCEANNACIFALDDCFDLDGNVEWNPARFINHSCAPNCETELMHGRICVLSTRRIRTGEEITFNYSYDLADYREHPCRCGSPDCAGYIVAEEFFPLLRRRQEAVLARVADRPASCG
jgi:SET domain-containing protein